MDPYLRRSHKTGQFVVSLGQARAGSHSNQAMICMARAVLSEVGVNYK